jgi:hypothetical protein
MRLTGQRRGGRVPVLKALLRLAARPPKDKTAPSQAAFDAVEVTLPLGSMGCEPGATARGERIFWIEAPVADRLAAMRGPSESYSDVILRLIELEQEPRYAPRGKGG